MMNPITISDAAIRKMGLDHHHLKISIVEPTSLAEFCATLQKFHHSASWMGTMIDAPLSAAGSSSAILPWCQLPASLSADTYEEQSSHLSLHDERPSIVELLRHMRDEFRSGTINIFDSEATLTRIIDQLSQASTVGLSPPYIPSASTLSSSEGF